MSSPESSPDPMPVNYSATKYSFREDEADSIIKTLGWGSRWYDDRMVRFPPEEHADVVSSLSQPFNRITTERLGSLDYLPLELLQDVILRLDIQSVFRFRQSNAKAREMVGTLKEYGIIMDHAMNITLPGSYGKTGTTVFKVRKDIISLYQACEMAGVEKPCNTFRRASSPIELMVSCCAPHYNIQTGKVTHGFRCAGCQRWARDQDFHDDSWLGSSEEISTSRADARLHDRNSFLEHFKRCQEGQRLWESSDGGAQVPARLPWGCRSYPLVVE
ncbi:hypothetical protein PspLS_06180 [Pyricularia sp. CBS 133598]|nr:hypothetical protein PspLS_06180 [Pyricularia sp. CBS 133598]